MRSTFHSIETAKRSLFTQTAALSTTGHNIANANTPGFSRQTVNMSAARPIEAYGLNRSNSPGQLGTGVEFLSITRVREAFLDAQFRNEQKGFGNWKIQTDTLDKLQAIMNEPSETGLRNVMDKFWSAWSDLSKNPESATGHKLVREQSIALVDSLNQMSIQLKDLQGDLTSNLTAKASEVQSTVTSIANLNREITRIEGLGDIANDLRDQRDLLTDKLSGIVNVQVTETDSGYSINMGGVALVEGYEAATVDGPLLEGAFQSGDLNSGEAFGMIQSRDRYVADYIKQMDALANTLANGDITITIPKGSVLPEGTVLNNTTYSGTNRQLANDITVTVKGINGLHRLGYNLTGKTGNDLFVAKDGGTEVTAGTIALNPDIMEDPSLIATSMRMDGTNTDSKVIVGDNSLAVLISQLKHTPFTFGEAGANVASSATVDDYFGSIVGQLGIQAQEADRQMKNQQVLAEQVENRRQSVSGVSLDEEMSNMIKFQHSYTAASRFMTTFDELLDKLINGTGTVGR